MDQYEVVLPGNETPKLVGQIRPKDLLRFLKKVKTENDCWIWTAHCDRKGYGQFWFQKKVWWAHRWAYAVFVGDIPGGHPIDHICRNPSCVCPAHLRVLGWSENTALGNKHRNGNEVTEEEVPF
jgi:hypothetical protein